MSWDTSTEAARRELAKPLGLHPEVWEKYHKPIMAKAGLPQPCEVDETDLNDLRVALKDPDFQKLLQGGQPTEPQPVNPTEKSLLKAWVQAYRDANRSCKGQSDLVKRLRRPVLGRVTPLYRGQDRMDRAREWWRARAGDSYAHLLDRPGRDDRDPAWGLLLEDPDPTAWRLLLEDVEQRAREDLDPARRQARAAAKSAASLAAAAEVTLGQALSFLLIGDVGGPQPPMRMWVTFTRNRRQTTTTYASYISKAVRNLVETTAHGRIFGERRPRPGPNRHGVRPPPPLTLDSTWPLRPCPAAPPQSLTSQVPLVGMAQGLFWSADGGYTCQATVEVDLEAISVPPVLRSA